MKRLRWILTLAAIASMLLGQMVTVSAQKSSSKTAGETYEFTQAGVNVEIADGSDLTFGSPFGETTDPYEGVQVEIGSGYALVVSFASSGSASTSMKEFIKGYTGDSQNVEDVETETGEDLSWTVIRHDMAGQDVVSVFYIDTTMVSGRDIAFLISAPEASVMDSVRAFQTDLTVDGNEAYEKLDADAIEEALGGKSTNGKDTKATAEPTRSSNRKKTPVATEESTEEATEEATRASGRKKTPEATEESTKEADGESKDPRDDAILTGKKGTDKKGNESETEAESTEEADSNETADPAELEAAGLESETSYVSPRYDTAVEFDGNDWVADPKNPKTATSDEAKDFDTLRLEWSSGGSLLWIDSMPAEGNTVADYVEYFQSSRYLKKNADPNAEVLDASEGDQRGAVVIRDYLNDGEEVIVLHEFIVDEKTDTLVKITFVAYTKDFEDAYTSATEVVTVNGEEVMNVYTVRELRKIVDQ